jgi:hypothetical protein
MRTSADIIALLELNSERFSSNSVLFQKRRAKNDPALMKPKSAALRHFGEDTDRSGKILH